MTNEPIDLEALTGRVAWSLIPPPPAVHQQLLHMFDDHHGVAPRRQRATARPVDDRAPMLVRGETAQQRIYTCDLGDVVVDVTGDRVSGSVIPLVRPTPSAFSVTVIGHPEIRSHEGGTDGSFALSGIPAGRQRLLLDNTHLEIEIDIDVENHGPGGAEGNSSWR